MLGNLRPVFYVALKTAAVAEWMSLTEETLSVRTLIKKTCWEAGRANQSRMRTKIILQEILFQVEIMFSSLFVGVENFLLVRQSS